MRFPAGTLQHRRSHPAALLAVAASVVLVWTLAVLPVVAGPVVTTRARHAVRTEATQRVSISSAGVEGNQDSFGVAVSTGGSFVAFSSRATNLVLGDTNGAMDVFVRDVAAGTTERVSISSGGVQGNGDSFEPRISSDGRFVSFASRAFNLVGEDHNGQADVFVHDRATGETVLVSANRYGTQGNGASLDPDLSADGRFVAFESAATNLVKNDANGQDDIFVKNLSTGAVALASVAWNGEQANSFSNEPSISDDGNVVGFASVASNLVEKQDINGAYDVFVRDLAAHTTILASSDVHGDYVEADSHFPSVSGDGRFVAFESNGPLRPALFQGFHVYLRELSTGDMRVIDGSTGPYTDRPVLSRTGRYVLFISDGANIVPHDTNGKIDVFVRDARTGRAVRVSVSSSGEEGNGDSGFSGGVDLSPDGRWAAFDSVATNLVDDDHNGKDDDFLNGPLWGG
jgi:Tol biopolymer transport system component